jgi:NADH-quinone oxidoreductase subunit E
LKIAKYRSNRELAAVMTVGRRSQPTIHCSTIENWHGSCVQAMGRFARRGAFHASFRRCTLVAPDIDAILQRYPDAHRDSLIPLLQEVQEQNGYVSREAVVRIGEHLKLPVSKIYGVATFYNQFRFQPQGKFHVQVCRGTACHVKGSAAVLDAIRRELKIDPGQTSRDGLFSLEVVACVGACGLAPVICINGEFHAGVTTQKCGKILESYRRKASQNGNGEAA